MTHDRFKTYGHINLYTWAGPIMREEGQRAFFSTICSLRNTFICTRISFQTEVKQPVIVCTEWPEGSAQRYSAFVPVHNRCSQLAGVLLLRIKQIMIFVKKSHFVPDEQSTQLHDCAPSLAPIMFNSILSLYSTWIRLEDMCGPLKLPYRGYLAYS